MNDSVGLDVFLELYHKKICDDMPKITAIEHRAALEHLWRTGTDTDTKYAAVLRFPITKIREVILKLVPTSSPPPPPPPTTTIVQTDSKLTYKQQLMVQRFLCEIKKAFPGQVYETLSSVFSQTYIEPIEMKGRALQLIVTQFLELTRPYLTSDMFAQVTTFAQRQM
jgi:hypothetical protein